ncbi:MULTISPECIES: uroporphyrinogen-III synthase [Parachlamydia]|uniref:uroporphyrinogen-III synthase n=1 Tax=Parachlamydia TaxID=83551 RepID=UPI0001C172F4|nr:uroporphyrinogen-III synthase [Parachlamydia acanthamoebae]EFB40352.1 hypothetical protein pah_c207o045 [Parachlamydia acanthamoebae str. Hall's coccus]
MSRILYLGLKIPKALYRQAIHCPIIKIAPRAFFEPDIIQAFSRFSDYTHLILTSQTAVQLFLEAAIFFQINADVINTKKIVAVGKKTAAELAKHRFSADFVPLEETAEGIRDLFANWDRTSLYVFWPHSALSRPLLTDYWKQNGIKHTDCVLYDTFTNHEVTLPDLSTIDEIVFTSPSTVDAFLERYYHIPRDKKLTFIGPVTAARLAKSL